MTKRISIALLLALAAAGTALAQEEYTRTFDRTLALKPGERFLLEHRLGDVTIRTHAGNEVMIHADIHVSAPDTAAAKALADRIEILVEPSPSILSVRTRYPERGEGMGSWLNRTSYSVRYDVTLPEATPTEVRNAFGAVSVTGLKADADIRNSNGALTFRDGRGTQRLSDAFGAVDVDGNAGNVTIENSNGAVNVANVTGDVTLHNRFGAVTVTRAKGGVRIVNSNGRVEVSDSGGTTVINSFGNVSVSDQHGDVRVNNANGNVEARDIGGSAELNSSFGQVHFEDVRGDVSVRSGNSTVSGRNAGREVSIRNSFGTVRLENTGSLNIETANSAVNAQNVRGAANVTTSFGAVLLDGVSGAAYVTDQNGAVDVKTTPGAACQPLDLRTSFSVLRVHVAASANYRVHAGTSFGSIRSDVPVKVSGAMSPSELNGVMGSGQCSMDLTNTNGSIEILKVGP